MIMSIKDINPSKLDSRIKNVDYFFYEKGKTYKIGSVYGDRKEQTVEDPDGTLRPTSNHASVFWEHWVFNEETNSGRWTNEVEYCPTEEGAKKLVAEIEALPNYEKV